MIAEWIETRRRNTQDRGIAITDSMIELYLSKYQTPIFGIHSDGVHDDGEHSNGEWCT